MAPLPTSPHIKVLVTVSSTFTLSFSFRKVSWIAVIGCSYIWVFMAGATRILPLFDLKSQARKTQLSRLSASPFENLAIVFAESGATKRISARSLNYMCKTGSDRYCQASYSSWSSNLSNNGSSEPILSVTSSRKWSDLPVGTIITLRFFSKSAFAIYTVFIVATEPVHPSSTVFLWELLTKSSFCLTSRPGCWCPPLSSILSYSTI